MLDQIKDPGYVDFLEPELLVPHYLIHCYLYYHVCRAIIEDHVFDALQARLAEEWDEVDHQHKHLIDRDGLKSGGHYIQHPLRVRQAALYVLHGCPDPPEALDWSVL